MAPGLGTERFEAHWRLWVLLFWAAAAVLLLYARWRYIGWFALSDTDDNLRMSQVRALIEGQGWFDLRQYRLDPPYGASVHWSRLVDLPIAGIKLALTPFLGGAAAERAAVAAAPMLPMGVAMAAVALTVRRLVAPSAFALAVALLLCAHSARGMWGPLRIDHHGWQLAMLALVVTGLSDPKRARGGALMGIATALSLVIGLELLIYLAAAGGIVALLWIRDPREGRRLLAYGASLAGGCAAGYLLFASYDNRAALCDALSPVWLSAMIAAGAVGVALPLLPLRAWPARLGTAAVAGALLAAGFALAWPHCLGRLEGVSPELQAMWLDNVREARPLYTHSWKTGLSVAWLPVMGLIGYGLTLWQGRGDAERLTRWAALAALALLPAALLLWQTRAGPAAQLLSIPGATALAWWLIAHARRLPEIWVQVTATVGAFLIVSGVGAQSIASQVPDKAAARNKAVAQANAKCPTLAALRPVARQPKGYVLTFVDLGPRLITVTHHNAVAGPYHRNGQAILDVMKSFRGTPDYARQVIQRRGIDYVLICPNLSESTVYRKESPNGFYAQLADGRSFDWLEPVELPENSPYRMWRVRR
jgi:hypothetical protein